MLSTFGITYGRKGFKTLVVDARTAAQVRHVVGDHIYHEILNSMSASWLSNAYLCLPIRRQRVGYYHSAVMERFGERFEVVRSAK